MSSDPPLKTWLAAARDRLAGAPPPPRLLQTGIVERIGDGVATVSGLPGTRLDELLRFEGGTLGLAMRISEREIGCVLLDTAESIAAGSRVTGTGQIIRVPVGEALLGRVVDALGAPMDDGPPLEPARFDPVERPAPAIVDRDLVTDPLATGLTVIDAMIPLGKGQRELIIGDRKTGKTAVAIDTMINQKDSDVICVYAAIGQKASTVARVIEAVRKHGAPEKCIFVVGTADAAPGAQWIAPYAACTMAEYFRDQGRDALLILDDLSKHAVIYRQISLLLRKPPGREAYPGDIFYLHARLLERAAKLSADLGGGSLTALPVAETQAGNLSAFIPTNLISITDGQIYLEPKLFFEGQKPAVNVGLSVSRVGGSTQAKAIKALAERLKLDYAQFLELEVFTRFGGVTDDRTKARIAHGKRIRAILAQPEFDPLPLSLQVALLLAAGKGRLDHLELAAIAGFRADLRARLADRAGSVLARIDVSGHLNEADEAALLREIDACLPQDSPEPQNKGDTDGASVEDPGAPA